MAVLREGSLADAMTQTAAATRAGSQRLREVESLVRVVSATIVIGAGSGAVIGGLGGRLAMRILFLTSGDGVKGLTSDDGFEIGRFHPFPEDAAELHRNRRSATPDYERAES